jgi:hypothetical protein
MPWIDNMAPEPPKNITIENNQLKWDAVATNNIFDETRFYVVYYYPEKQNKHIKSVDFLVEITGETQIKLPKIPNKGCYRISSLDRLNNESQLSDPFELNADN